VPDLAKSGDPLARRRGTVSSGELRRRPRVQTFLAARSGISGHD